MAATIAAIATAPGQGGISIIRLSGDEAEKVLMRLFRPKQQRLKQLASHMLTYGHIVYQGEVVDECMAVLMHSPRTYTREDVAEIHLHGGYFTAQRVLTVCLATGAMLAEPGEFTRRAFQNGRIDLSQAEAVMELIAARGEMAHQAAIHQLQGTAGAFVRQAADILYGIQASLAACIDYPEEITDEEATHDLLPRLDDLVAMLMHAADERNAHLITNGLQVVICGKPNVGKSSLLNALLKEERAIVTDIPGTTRDVIQGEITLNGCIISLTDTAGIHDTDDTVESIGVVRAQKAVAHADVVLLVLDGSRKLDDEDFRLAETLYDRDAVILVNKADLPQVLDIECIQRLLPNAQVIALSAHNEHTLQQLKDHLAAKASLSDRLTLTQPRHLACAHRALQHLQDGKASAEHGQLDLVAIDLSLAQAALGEITGDQVSERLLDEVFAQFCVGK